MKQNTTAYIFNTSLIGALTLLCGLLVASCTPKKNSPTGFILPPGDAMAGQTTFAALGCISCHKVDGVSFTANDVIAPDLIVELGGQQPLVKTYGQLVTAIIHPNSDILKNNRSFMDAEGQSLMPDYTQIMTVQQMTDLVTFLLEHYEIAPPEYDPRNFGYPYP